MLRSTLMLLDLEILLNRRKRAINTVDGINLATPKGLDMESRKPKSPRKNQKLGTIVHLPARMYAILKQIILTLQAASAYTHFRGGVMGSNAYFMENGLKPKEFVYPSAIHHKSKIGTKPS